MKILLLVLRRVFGGSDRGAVLVEYTAVFALVSIGIALAIIKLGPTLLTAWDATRGVLLANKP